MAGVGDWFEDKHYNQVKVLTCNPNHGWSCVYVLHHGIAPMFTHEVQAATPLSKEETVQALDRQLRQDAYPRYDYATNIGLYDETQEELNKNRDHQGFYVDPKEATE